MKTETMWYIALIGLPPDKWGIEVVPFERSPHGVTLLDDTAYKTKKRALIALIRNLNRDIDRNKVELGEILLKEQEELLKDPKQNFYQSMLLDQERQRRENAEKWLKERAKK